MRALRWILITLVVIVVGIIIVYQLKDPESRTLDDARKEVGGVYVRLPDGVTHYERTGPDTARAVVLAAGNSVPYYIWDSLYRRLADSGFQVIRYDYYGRGWSDRPEIEYDQALYVRQLNDLLDSLHITQPIDLAGLSFGGVVITSFAAAHPERVHSLLFFDPAIATGPHPVPSQLRSPLRWNISMVLRGESDRMATGQTTDLLHPERFPDWVDRYRVQQGIHGFREASRRRAIGFLSAVAQDTIRARLGAEPRPVLVVWGKQDSTLPVSGSAALLAAMPRAELLLVDSAGHIPYLEQPELVGNAVIAFLKKSP